MSGKQGYRKKDQRRALPKLPLPLMGLAHFLPSFERESLSDLYRRKERRLLQEATEHYNDPWYALSAEALPEEYEGVGMESLQDWLESDDEDRDHCPVRSRVNTSPKEWGNPEIPAREAVFVKMGSGKTDWVIQS